MKYLLAFLLWNSVALGAVRPLDRVYAYAGKHKVAVRLVSGVYWVEMEGSDIFGVGPTVDEAAEDFLGDADLEAHEAGRPYLKLYSGEEATPFVCPKEDACI